MHVRLGRPQLIGNSEASTEPEPVALTGMLVKSFLLEGTRPVYLRDTSDQIDGGAGADCYHAFIPIEDDALGGLSEPCKRQSRACILCI